MSRPAMIRRCDLDIRFGHDVRFGQDVKVILKETPKGRFVQYRRFEPTLQRCRPIEVVRDDPGPRPVEIITMLPEARDTIRYEQVEDHLDRLLDFYRLHARLGQWIFLFYFALFGAFCTLIFQAGASPEAWVESRWVCLLGALVSFVSLWHCYLAWRCAARLGLSIDALTDELELHPLPLAESRATVVWLAPLSVVFLGYFLWTLFSI